MKQVDKKSKYPEWAKIPNNYDFSTRKKDWSQFYKHFILRTDAVWEKFKLKDFFRLYYKVFYFDAKKEEYYIIPPIELSSHFYFGVDGNRDQEEKWFGFSLTGASKSYKQTQGPREKVHVPLQTNYLKQDYYDVCCLRFQKWYDCDYKYYHQKEKYDKYPNFEPYPCHPEYYEAQYSCSDDLFDFMLELSYSRKINNISKEDFLNVEIKDLPTIYDNPSTNRKSYTY